MVRVTVVGISDQKASLRLEIAEDVLRRDLAQRCGRSQINYKDCTIFYPTRLILQRPAFWSPRLND